MRPHGNHQLGRIVQTASAFFAADPATLTAREEALFFGRLKTGNATFKRTAHGRLRMIDEALVAQLDRAGARVDRVLDLGISSGITTVELAEALGLSGRSASVTGTDRSLEAFLVDLPMGCRALVEPNGHVLQYEVLGRAVRPWTRRLDYVTGMALARSLLNRMLGPVARARTAHRAIAASVALVSPRLSRSVGVELAEDDVTRSNPRFVGGFDLVRAANILNRHYFDADALERAVGNVKSYLRGPGAWLLVVRTLGATDHHGTLFRMNAAHGLDVVERWGQGSEVEALVLQSRQQPDQRG